MRETLIALRRAMQAAGVDAYVIPTDDFHGSEYVGDYFKCRKYVSGFTGSAGTLVVTADMAGLWTDGRYFLQAAQELRDSGIDLMKMGEKDTPSIKAFLADRLVPGQTLGFDGRTMTLQSGRELETAMEKHGISLRQDLDLVGEIWRDRPSLPGGEAWALPASYAGKGRKDKLGGLRREMEALGADTHILTSLDDICWLLNLRGDDVECCPVILSFLIMDGSGVRLYMDEKKLHPKLRGFLEADGVKLLPYLQIFSDVGEISPDAKVLLDPEKVSYAIVRRLPETAVVIEKANPTERAKAVKTQAEQDNMRAAHVKDGVALVKFTKWLKEHVGKVPMTEISAAEKLESLRAAQDFYHGPSFDPIFGYGPHGAIVHYSATQETDAAIAPEGFLLFDTGGHYLEGTTDVTRTVALGPVTAEMKRHFTLVLKGHLRLLGAKFRQGCSGVSLDILARQPLWEAGLDYNHGTGHGVGYLLSVHEGPQRIHYNTATVPAKLEPGMITSDEPGLYLTGQYGIRHESLLLCVEKETNEFGTFLGFEPLTMCPFDLDAVDPDLMTREEKDLLNDYHQRVFETISPYLCEKGTAWLKNATRPI